MCLERIALLIAVVVAASLGVDGIADEGPTWILGVHASLPGFAEPSAHLALRTPIAKVDLQLAAAVPNDARFQVSIAAEIAGDLFQVRAAIHHLFSAPRLQADVDFSLAGAELSAGGQWSLRPEMSPWPSRLYGDVRFEPIEDLQLSGRIWDTWLGLLPQLVAEYSAAEINIRFSQARTSPFTTQSAYELRLTSLGLGVVHSVRRAEGGRSTSTRWIALAPSVSESPSRCPALLTSCALSSLAPHTTEVVDQLPVDGVLDFGRVPITDAEPGRKTLLLQCVELAAVPDWHNARRAAITKQPSRPFSAAVSATEWVAQGETHVVDLEFAPTTSGPSEDTVEIAYESAYIPALAPDYEPPDCEPGVPASSRNPVCVSTYVISLELNGEGIAPPLAKPECTPTRPTAGRKAQFSSESSYDQNVGGRIIRWEWDFGDGSPVSTARNPEHSYGSAGEYTATLTVWNDGGVRSKPQSLDVPVRRNVLRTIPPIAAAAATYVANTSAPILLPLPPAGFVDPIATQAGEAYVRDQLIVYAPDGTSKYRARREIRRIMPDAEFAGYNSTQSAHLVKLPPFSEVSLDEWRRRLYAQLPAGFVVDDNSICTTESGARTLEGHDSDFGRLDSDLRQPYDAICTRDALEAIEALDLGGLRPWFNNVRIAIIDTGVHAKHKDFCQEGANTSFSGISYVASKDNPSEEAPWFIDCVGHGTCVAGLVAACDRNGGAAGLVSTMNSEFDIHVYRTNLDEFTIQRCIDIADSLTADIPKALAGEEVPGGWTGNTIINLSLGVTDGSWDSSQKMLDCMKDNPRLLFVCSAGNGRRPLPGYGETHYPGGLCAPNCITVAALDPTTRQLMPSSNLGPGVDIAAPGDSLYTCNSDLSENHDYPYTVESGTSFSAAVTTATAAIVWSLAPGLSAEEVKDILIDIPKTPDSHAPNTKDGKPFGKPIPILDVRHSIAEVLERRREYEDKAFVDALAAGGCTYILQCVLGIQF